MRFGFAKRMITPPLPCTLAGFDAYRPCSKVHDDLYAKVMILEFLDKKYCLVNCDLLAIDNLIYEPCFSFACGLNISSLIICATHTHSGPGGILDTDNGFLKGGKDLLGNTDHQLIAYIVEQINQGIQEAIDDLQVSIVKVGFGKCEGVGKNRNSLKFAGNDDLWLCEISNKHKKVLLVNFACHPTILNDKNLEISADFPGRLDELMQDKYMMTIFLNGSCGDISTRFTRKENGFKEVDNKAYILKAKIDDILSKIEEGGIDSLESKNVEICLKAKKAISIEEAQDKLKEAKKRLEKAIKDNITGSKLRLLENDVEGCNANIRFIKNCPLVDNYKFNIPMFKLNEDIFIFIPGELFSQLSNPLQTEHVHFIGYANNYYMYFADKYAYEHYGYEAMSSPFAYGESEKMMKIIKEEIDNWR